jgi:hypothetical protein
MKIKNIKGNIYEITPDLAEACILYLRSGFNPSFSEWQYNFLPKFKNLIHYKGNKLDILKPWQSKEDTILELKPKQNKWKYIYVFSNPKNEKGFSSETELRDKINLSLSSLSDLGVTKVSSIHLPIINLKSIDSAKIMLNQIRDFGAIKKSNINELFLVDLNDSFKQIIDQKK